MSKLPKDRDEIGQSALPVSGPWPPWRCSFVDASPGVHTVVSSPHHSVLRLEIDRAGVVKMSGYPTQGNVTLGAEIRKASQLPHSPSLQNSDHSVSKLLLPNIGNNIVMTRTSLFLFILCCFVTLPSALGQAGGTFAERPGAGGIDLGGRDTTVRPGDNFFRYANGGYLDRLVIPLDRSGYSTASFLTDAAQAKLRTLLEAAAREGRVGSGERMAGDYYAAFMDESRIEHLGITPLLLELKSIHGATLRKALATLMGRENVSLLGSIFHLDISPDIMDPQHYAVQISQPSLSLPDRGYYLDPSSAAQRDDYKTYITKLLELANWPEPHERAEEIVQFETSLAKVSWDRERERDPTNTYNPVTLRQLEAGALGFPWSDFLTAAGVVSEEKFIVVEKTAISQIAALYGRTPPVTLQAWEAFALLDHAAPYLSKPFADAAFELHGKSLKGQKQQLARWKRGLNLVSGGNDMSQVESAANLGDAIGQLYVSAYFQPEARVQMEALVAEVKAALRARIESLTWMAPTTKTEALHKLEKYTIQIGYPNHWRNYNGLRIDQDDLVGDIEHASAFNWRYHVNKLHAPVDQLEWAMEPQTVNAYNDSALRQIVFSAALLQPPAFNPQADPAVNYGAIGAIIGHELTHGFDDQGRRFDSEGRMRNWWAASDTKKFLAKAAGLGAQFDACEALPGMHVNGKLTMGENIADLGGLALALDAYHASLKGKPAPVIDGLSGDQRFFLSFAQVRRSKNTEQALKEQVLVDPHSPDECRVNIEVRNLDTWYSAFHVTAGEKLYLTPESRVRIW
jgi:putative endopeptidase